MSTPSGIIWQIPLFCPKSVLGLRVCYDLEQSSWAKVYLVKATTKTLLQNSLRRVMRCTSPCTRPRGVPGTLWWSPQAVMTQKSTRTVTTLGTGWTPPSTSVQYTLSVIGLTSGEFICSVSGWLQLPCRKDMYLLSKYEWCCDCL